MKTRFSIYCHTNKVNGKRYIGQTVLSMEKRWREHVTYAMRGDRRGSPLLSAAIRKYGAGAFVHELLDVVTSQNGADIAERVWIEQRFSLKPDGYNLLSGGGGHGHHHDESKRLIGAASKRMTPAQRANQAQKMREWQISQAKLRTPEQRKEIAKKAAATRKLRYGQSGVKQPKTSEQQREVLKKAWETRRIKYGTKPEGRLSRAKLKHELLTSDQRSESIKKAWVTRRLNKINKTER